MNKKLIPTEHDEQVMFFKLVHLYSKKYPELLNVYAVPNGGKRNVGVAKKMKAEGVQAGVPDINVDVARGEWHGMRIEMKRSDGGSGLTKAQKEWFRRLTNEGYLCVVAPGCRAAWESVCDYLGFSAWLPREFPVFQNREQSRPKGHPNKD